ncbi:MAG: AtpZ/AtpI family protein [Alphaproteobacteria bacterium]|nr:AtpZ/AtpI family protein [Alphaproteobacteria bacterium]
MAEDQEDDEPEANGASFEQRLRAARERAGIDTKQSAKPDRVDPLSGSPWSVGLRVGVELVAALVVGVGIGWLLDRWLHTRPVFLAIFVLLGGAAGVRNVYRVFAPRD